MNQQSTENCALSAQRGEAAYKDMEQMIDKREAMHDLLATLQQETILYVYNPSFAQRKQTIRKLLRTCARFCDIPVTGED